MWAYKKTIKYSGLLVGALLTGCHSIGPYNLPLDRYNYNKAVNYSTNQEMLLNLVRLRYDETPLSMKVGTISGSTSYQRQAGLAGTINFPSVAPTNGSLNPAGTVSYTDNPIISYTPLEDQAFTQSFLARMNLYDVSLLLDSAWSIPRVLRVGFQRIGNAYNAPSAARSTSSHVPEYQNFIDMTYVLRRMQLANATTGFYSKKGNVEDLTLVIDPHYHITAKELAILRKAGVVIHDHKIVFSTELAPHKVYVVPRSIIGIYNYLSKGLIEPSADLKAKVLTETVYANGSHFDWQNVLRGMMKIYSSDKEPKDAFVSIAYRGHWFYIKDSDSDSKQTLSMLISIAGLIHNGPSASSAPALARVV